MRIRIFQPIVPEYRVALFEGVGKRYGDNVEIWADAGSGQDRSYPLENMRYDYSHSFKRFGLIRWQRGLSLKGLARDDVIVVCGDVHQLSSLWIAFKAKCCGIKVVWWGHHVSVGSKKLGIRIRLFFTKWLSDVVLCYTQQGVEWFRSRGWASPVFATGNTIDMNSVKNAIAAWTPEKLMVFQREHGLEKQEVIVFCSVLRWKTRLDQLLRAMALEDLRQRGTKLVIIGDGEGRATWVKLAQDLGVQDRVIWVGALRDQMKIAPWFLSAKAYVYPGPIGLSIIHAFSYGLPVICHDNMAQHGPEFEAMADGWTGFTFKENDVDDLVRQIVRLLADEARRQKMSCCAQEIAFERYSMDRMIDNYCAAISATMDAQS